MKHIASVPLTGSLVALKKRGYFGKLGNSVIVRRLKPVNTQHQVIARHSTPKAFEDFLPFMSSFGVPPDPARIVSYFPGMSARNFSPIGANVCYRESIMKENTTRSDAFESAQRSEAQVVTFVLHFAISTFCRPLGYCTSQILSQIMQF